MHPLRTLLDLILAPRRSERLVREADISTLGILIQPTTILSAPFPTTALLPYRHLLVEAAIKELKFHHNKKAAMLLGSLLAEYLDGFLQEDSALSPSRYRIVPIPLSRRRYRERGHNQVETLVKQVVAHMQEPVEVLSVALVRAKETRPQTSLSRKERIVNMEGAFTATASLDPTHTYILVDDVTTTGATLQAAVRALCAAGAKNILPIALAH